MHVIYLITYIFTKSVLYFSVSTAPSSGRTSCHLLKTICFFIIVDAQQARAINNYKNTTHKLPETNAAIWYVQQYMQTKTGSFERVIQISP
jgi:hypothetical protein